MEGIKRILAAIDFSQYSPQVLRFAVGLTQELKAQLVVVNVLNQRDVHSTACRCRCHWLKWAGRYILITSAPCPTGEQSILTI